MEKVEFSMKHLEKEAQYLRVEVREEAQDIKDELGGKVESTAQEVQRLGQDIKDELGGKVESTAQEVQRLGQDIKDELGGKVESTAQEVQRLRQEFRDEAQDIKDRLKLGGRPNSSAGGQLVDIYCISITSKVFFLLHKHLRNAQGSPVRCTLYTFYDRNGFIYF